MKQETLEEAAEEFGKNHSIYETAQDDAEYGFWHGAKWQQERMYSEEDILINIELAMIQGLTLGEYRDLLIEQFKKK
jgi:hypothetical protein